jgi:hypothetical protein
MGVKASRVKEPAEFYDLLNDEPGPKLLDPATLRKAIKEDEIRPLKKAEKKGLLIPTDQMDVSGKMRDPFEYACYLGSTGVAWWLLGYADRHQLKFDLKGPDGHNLTLLALHEKVDDVNWLIATAEARGDPFDTYAVHRAFEVSATAGSTEIATFLLDFCRDGAKKVVGYTGRIVENLVTSVMLYDHPCHRQRLVWFVKLCKAKGCPITMDGFVSMALTAYSLHTYSARRVLWVLRLAYKEKGGRILHRFVKAHREGSKEMIGFVNWLEANRHLLAKSTWELIK